MTSVHRESSIQSTQKDGVTSTISNEWIIKLLQKYIKGRYDNHSNYCDLFDHIAEF